MLAIASVTSPFFALIGIGYVAGRTRALPAGSVPGLNAFVLYFALTALLFRVSADIPVAQLLAPVPIAVWLVSGLAVLAFGTIPARQGGRSWLDSAFGGLIASQSNSGFMGLPLLVALLGPAAAGPVSTTLLVDVVIIQSVAVVISRRDLPGPDSLTAELSASLRRAAANPLPWAIIAGVLWGTLGLKLPEPVDAVMTLLAAAATPVALFTIGAVLARSAPVRMSPTGAHGLADASRPRHGVRDISWLTGLKLVVHPMLVYGLSYLAVMFGLPLDDDVKLTLVLVASLPAAANVTLLAERFAADGSRVARVILISTLLSFLTVTWAATLLT